LRYDGQNVLLDTEAPEPSPAPGEALIRPLRVGLTSPDLAAAQGRIGFVGTLGHEFVGEVQAVWNADAEAMEHELVGRRVVGSPRVVCRVCHLCRAGLSSHCQSRQVLGLHGRNGALADLFTLPTANLCIVPDEVDDESASFASSVAAAFHVAQMLHVEGKPYITILGDGAMGLLTAQVMARLNASVRVLGRHPEKFCLAEKWGVKHRHVDDVGLRKDQDIVVDCTGEPGGLMQAMAMARPRGTIVLKTTISPSPGARCPVQVDLTPLVNEEITLIGSRCGNVLDGLGAIQRGEVEVPALVTGRMSLDRGVEALAAAREPGQIRILIEA